MTRGKRTAKVFSAGKVRHCQSSTRVVPRELQDRIVPEISLRRRRVRCASKAREILRVSSEDTSRATTFV